MKKLLLAAAAVLAFSTPALAADGRGRDNGRDHRSYDRDGGRDHRGWQRDHRSDRGRDRWDNRRSYRSYYAPRYRTPYYYGSPYAYGYFYGAPYYDGYGYSGNGLSLGLYLN